MDLYSAFRSEDTEGLTFNFYKVRCCVFSYTSVSYNAIWP